MKTPAQRIREAQERLWRRLPALRPSAPQPTPPPPPDGRRLVLGRDKEGMPFAFDTRAVATHIDIVGGIGGGKSTAMRHLGWQHMEGEGALIQIDPHGNHPDSLHRLTLRRIIETGLHKRKPVYVIDPNSEWCTGLRLLTSEAEPSVMADHMIEGFERMQGDETLLEKPTLRRALHGLLALLAELDWSLAEADLLLDPSDPFGVRAWAIDRVNDRYAKKALARLCYLACDQRLLKEFEIETIGTENRLAPLLSSPAMRAIVGTQTLDLRSVLDEGAVLLVNTAGLNAASETAGDLLGKLVMRAVLFAAKRRSSDKLALVIADECARYVSEDWERALAELRKYNVGICSAHQTFAMLGKPGDPVRDAIEKIPGTKIAFRLTSMAEAIAVAPELMALNLEMPVQTLVGPAVVGYEVRRSASASSGRTTTHGQSDARTQGVAHGATTSRSETAGVSSSVAKSEQRSTASGKGKSRSTTRSEQESFGTTQSHTETEGQSRSEGVTRTVGSSRAFGTTESEQVSNTSGWSRSHGTSTSAQSSRTSSSNFNQSFDVEPNAWQSGERAYVNGVLGVASGRHVGAGYGSAETHGTSVSSSESETQSGSTSRSYGSTTSRSETSSESVANSEQRGWTSSVAKGTATFKTRGTGHSVSEGESHSLTHGSSHGTALTHGHQKSCNKAVGVSMTRSDSSTRGQSSAQGESWTRGWSETLVPVLRERPTSVHSLPNVTHMAAEMLCGLPTGFAVVRTAQRGTILSAVVKVPERPAASVSDELYAEDVAVVSKANGVALLMSDAMRSIDKREQQLLASAARSTETIEPKSFRVPAPKKKLPKS